MIFVNSVAQNHSERRIKSQKRIAEARKEINLSPLFAPDPTKNS